MEKSNREYGRNVWKPLCLVFAVLLIFTWTFIGFLYNNRNRFTGFTASETPGFSQAARGGAVIGESVGDGIKLMSEKIEPKAYAENGVSAQADTAYTLTATIAPDNAANKAVDWTVSFVNPASAWASGKSVSDYVTVTPTSDGALTANVECLKAFGEQIKVIAAVRETPSVKAECLVDYMERLSSKPTFNGASFWFLPSMVNIPFPMFFEAGDTCTMGLCTKWTETGKYKPSLRESGSVYTVSDKYSITSCDLFVSDEVKSYFSSHSVPSLDLEEYWIPVEDDFTPNLYLFQKIFGEKIAKNGVSMIMLANGLNECDVDLELHITVRGTYSEEDYVVYFNIDTSTLQMEIPGQAAYAPSVSLDETQTIL